MKEFATKKQLLHLALKMSYKYAKRLLGHYPAFQQNLGKNMRLY
jgi:hypothetical protein